MVSYIILGCQTKAMEANGKFLYCSITFANIYDDLLNFGILKNKMV